MNGDKTSKRVLGDFEILREIGRGGMGVVYEARQRSLNRRVALKVLSSGLGLSEKAITRFRREAEAAAKLHHTNIVPIYATGEEHGTHYYAMELIDGPSLDQVIRQMRAKPGITAPASSQNDTSGDASPAEPLPAWVGETIAFERSPRPHDESSRDTPQSDAKSNSSLSSSASTKYFDTVAKMMADVADALQHAHGEGVIHRDIKPSNLLLSPDGRLSLNDFGLARMLEQPGMTMSGEFVGTPMYMSPEQITAGRAPLDHRTDIYSLGATLYELLTLELPFPGQQRDQVIAQILHKDPVPCRRKNRKVPLDLETICLKALEKDPDRRYATAKELSADLRRYINGFTVKAQRPHLGRRTVKFVRRNKSAVVVSAMVVILIGVTSFLGWSVSVRQQSLDAERTAREQERLVREELLPRMEELFKAGRTVAAFSLATEAKRILPGDPTVSEFWSRVSTQTRVRTQPSGVQVTLRDWRYVEDKWSPRGLTPFEDLSVPKGWLRWEFEKEGHARVKTLKTANADKMVEVTLDSDAYLRKHEIGTGMVRVASGKARYTDDEAIEEDFFIDTFEVSNQEYSRFVESDGYRDAKWWEDQLFEENGATLNWHVVVSQFVDRTGMPGPATWINGTFPDGEVNYPVRGVSWHEAVAYAKFAGKQLPTVAHWDRAASLNAATQILPLSNFTGKGPAARERYQGISAFGAYDMAGNVKEWCWNEMDGGRRWVRGGAWDEPSYMFVHTDAELSLARPETVGFRCMKRLAGSPQAQLSARRPAFRDYRKEIPISREEANAFKLLYAIDSTVPLEPIVLSSESVLTSTHETISVNSAHRSGRLILHLFLPGVQTTKHQGIVYCPGAGSFHNSNFSEALSTGEITAPLSLVQNGRVVCWPIFKNMFERRGESSGSRLNWWNEVHLDVVRDARRAVDYLQTREDVDPNSISFVGMSWGGAIAPIVVAVEPRFRACIMFTAGLHNSPIPAEVDPYNFAPLVSIPVLMLNGQYDYIFPTEVSQTPLYQALGSKDKNQIRYESTHSIPLDRALPMANEWLDNHLASPHGVREK